MGSGVHGWRPDSVRWGGSLFGWSCQADRPGATAPPCCPSHHPAGCVTLDSHLTSLFLDPVQPLMSAKPWRSSGKGDKTGVGTVYVPPFLRGLPVGDGTIHVQSVCWCSLASGGFHHPGNQAAPWGTTFPSINWRHFHDNPFTVEALKLRERKWLAQGHTAQWQSWN